MTDSVCQVCDAAFAAGRCPRCRRLACSSDLVISAKRGDGWGNPVRGSFAGRPGDVLITGLQHPEHRNWKSTDGQKTAEDVFEDAWMEGGPGCVACRWQAALAAVDAAVREDEAAQHRGREEAESLTGAALIESVRRNGKNMTQQDLWRVVELLIDDGTLQPAYQEAEVLWTKSLFRSQVAVEPTGREFWVARKVRWGTDDNGHVRYVDVVFDRSGEAYTLGGSVRLSRGVPERAFLALAEPLDWTPSYDDKVSVQGFPVRRSIGECPREAMLELFHQIVAA